MRITRSAPGRAGAGAPASSRRSWPSAPSQLVAEAPAAELPDPGPRSRGGQPSSCPSVKAEGIETPWVTARVGAAVSDRPAGGQHRLPPAPRPARRARRRRRVSSPRAPVRAPCSAASNQAQTRVSRPPVGRAYRGRPAPCPTGMGASGRTRRASGSSVSGKASSLRAPAPADPRRGPRSARRRRAVRRRQGGRIEGDAEVDDGGLQGAEARQPFQAVHWEGRPSRWPRAPSGMETDPSCRPDHLGRPRGAARRRPAGAGVRSGAHPPEEDHAEATRPGCPGDDGGGPVTVTAGGPGRASEPNKPAGPLATAPIDRAADGVEGFEGPINQQSPGASASSDGPPSRRRGRCPGPAGDRSPSSTSSIQRKGSPWVRHT